MLNLEAVPLLDPTSRRLFEAASRNNNTLLQTSVLMDAQIVDAQVRAHYDPTINIPEFRDEIIDMTHRANLSIEAADRTGQGNWTDYYRLVSQTAFLEQRLKAPFVFDDRRYYRERGKLVNGIYDISAGIIDEALREHDSESATLSDKEQLRGVIQEQTVVALTNKEEQQMQIALPAATCSDIYHKIDIEVWSLPDRQADPLYLPVQIKSSTYTDEVYATPEGGITLYAYEFNNSHHMSVSRLIAHDHHYMNDTAEALTPRQTHQLELARKRLFMTMARKIRHLY